MIKVIVTVALILAMAAGLGGCTTIEQLECYTTGDDAPWWGYANEWNAQTFTPDTTHRIFSVKLLLYRLGEPGYFWVSINAIDGNGRPTGDDLCSATTDGNTLTTDLAGEWMEISFLDNPILAANTTYAILIRAPYGAEGVNEIRGRCDCSGAYAGGWYLSSPDGGSTWEDYDEEVDLLFEEWGVH